MIKDLIFDIGMNNGDDTAYYLHRGFRVVAVEANPQLVEQTNIRFKTEIEAGRLTILTVGITEREGKMPFWVCENHPEWSSFNLSVASRDNAPHHELIVPCRTFASIVNEFGVPYYLKIDIEENDVLCLHGLSAGDLPKYISVEASNIDLLELLAEQGYTRFKCISQFHYIPVQNPPCAQHRSMEKIQQLLKSENIFVRAACSLGARKCLKYLGNRHRKFAGWRFPSGSSGPFGEQLLGYWQDLTTMKSTFRSYQEMMERGENSIFWTGKSYSFWADFHATK